MGRAWRIEFEGALYHILSRGNEQKDIFYDDQDRQLFLKTIGEMSERFEIDVFAYVLMGNHYHLLLKTNRSNLSKSMQWLGLTYTRRFNLRHIRSGHLFQGRFKSIIVQNDAYLMRLSCYIHRNPLRAGIVERLVDYRWSSYKAYAYGDKALKWLLTKPIFSQFKGKDKHKAYREKVQSYAKEEKKLWEDFRHGMIIGSKKFVDKIRGAYLPENLHKEIPQQRDLAKGIDPVARLRKAARMLDCDLDHFRRVPRITKADRDDRDLLVLSVWKTGVLTNNEIGRLFGMTYSSVSHIVRSAMQRMEKNNNLKERFDHVYSLFKI
ncbi:MAG: transposase [Desulfobacteraceae bacterium]|jgi:REP-associated tyrosine transposase|nr:transposase [Desulfobacteraceae bacterium]MDH3575043.1 transposase [Desulfobacteraceae bacterium]MDH3838474.1 transposase [Desulfobacteraceae bacterium]MDH3875895.1 transposase [Desulfobacteraceae bacterium]